MPMLYCGICQRSTFHWAATKHTCSEHSNWPNTTQLNGHQLRLKGKGVVKTGHDDKVLPAAVPLMRRVRRVSKGVVITPAMVEALFARLGLAPGIARSGLFCSFCGDHVPETKATITQGKPTAHVSIEEIWKDGKVISWDDKVTYTAGKIVSCPNCVLKARDKDGKVKQPQFGEFD